MIESEYDPLIRLLIQLVQIPLFSLAALCIFAIGQYESKTRWWGWILAGYCLLVAQRIIAMYALSNPGVIRLFAYGILPCFTGACLFMGCLGYVRNLWRKR